MFKETPEGQTHYENDGCGIKEHNKSVVKESCGKWTTMSDGKKHPCLLTKPCWKHPEKEPEKETELLGKLADILFQDMNFHNPHEIVIQARTFLLDLGIILKKK